MPWPSGLFEVDDSTQPTGRRLALGPQTLPVNRDGVQIRPDMFANKDGYAPLGPLLAWFGDVSLAGTIGHTDLDAYLAPDAKTAIVDVGSGERMPHFVELDMTADAGQRVLMLRPVTPLPHGRRFAVGIRGLTMEDGGDVSVSPAFVALRDSVVGTDADVESRRDRFDTEVFPSLESAGFPRGDLQLAWEFTTGSREASLGPALAMRDDALARIGDTGPPYQIDTVEDTDCTVAGEHIARTVYGHFTGPRYTDVDEPGALLTRGDDGLPFYNGDTDVDFMIRIPCSVAADPGAGAPVLQYGHGLLGGLGEARTGYLTEFIDTHGYVLLAQNWTGMSEYDVGFITLMLALDASDFLAVPDRTQQGFVEFVAGLRLATGRLADDPQLAFEGRSVISKTATPVYYGNSQGAILGAAYFALSPDLERGVFGVGGMPYSLLLSRSADFDPFFFVFKEKFLDRRDIAVLLAAFQTVWDPGESSGYATALADPLPGTPSKRMLMQVAIGDAQVTTLGAHIAARAFGASSVAPAVRPIWGVEEVAAPFEGSALVEWRYVDGAEEPIINVPPDSAGDTHECPRREAAAQEQLATFLETGVIVQPCTGPCEGTRAGFCD